MRHPKLGSISTNDHTGAKVNTKAGHLKEYEEKYNSVQKFVILLAIQCVFLATGFYYGLHRYRRDIKLVNPDYPSGVLLLPILLPIASLTIMILTYLSNKKNIIRVTSILFVSEALVFGAFLLCAIALFLATGNVLSETGTCFQFGDMLDNSRTRINCTFFWNSHRCFAVFVILETLISLLASAAIIMSHNNIVYRVEVEGEKISLGF